MNSPHPSPLPIAPPTPQRGEGDVPLALREERLPVQMVERLHRAVGGDARVENIILRFIADRYGAKNLLHLSQNVSQAALKRPADFIRAAKQHGEPELSF